MNSAPPLILDFDGSAGALPGALRLDCAAWQEQIRFGASWRAYRALSRDLARQWPQQHGAVLLGSGDYHHLSYFLLQRLARRSAEKIHVVVADNHPDNMRYPFGIHCGSWVSHAAALPFVARIDVLGITSGDIGAARAWENRLLPLRRGKLRYWSIGCNVGWARLLGLGGALRNFRSAEEMAAAFLAEQAAERSPVYLSLDKDALAPAAVRTNWDQGVMTEATLAELIQGLKPRIIAADITGDVSDYAYQSRFKRFLSRLDGQQPAPPAQLAAWQQRQQAFNRRLLQLLA